MRGHKQLIDMRLTGYVPLVVYIDTANTGSADCDDWDGWHPASASIWIQENDPIDRLDLRCLIGLLVTITGVNAERVQRVAAAASKAGASRILTHVAQLQEGAYQTVIHTDSQGNYSWPN